MSRFIGIMKMMMGNILTNLPRPIIFILTMEKICFNMKKQCPSTVNGGLNMYTNF